MPDQADQSAPPPSEPPSEEPRARACRAAPAAAVQELLADFGADSRRVRDVLCRLAGTPGDDRGWTVSALVAATQLSRRTVESVLRAAADDLDTRADGTHRIAAGHAAAYRDALRCGAVAVSALADPVAHLTGRYRDELTEIAALVAAAPRSRRSLDHVAATPETALRRALYLGTRFWLPGTRLLCVGDHDLTSLATTLLHPEVDVTVVDIDERICEFLDREAARRGLPVRSRYGDLRLGLPPSLAGTADLVFTDPPYTAEGVTLFLTRGLEGLRDRANGRLLMAYGYGETMPGLGAKVQAAVTDLHLVYEAVLPGFNRYQGAEALGGVSDLYVCRPTARTWPTLAAREARAARGDESTGAANIYSQGGQSVEARTEAAARHGWDADAAAAVTDRHAPDLLVGQWPPDAGPGLPRVPLGGWLAAPTGTGPGRAAGGKAGPVRPAAPAARPAVNLGGGYDTSLLRVLLAARADRLAVVVDNNAEDVRSADGQAELARLVAPSYRLRFLRSVPTPKLAVVVAERAEPAGEAATVIRFLQDRPHGKVGNAWREGLIALSRSAGAAAGRPVLTKNAARALVAAATGGSAGGRTEDSMLGASLLELPRHRLHALAEAVAASVARWRDERD
jgi:N4-bis(aminopropyl)spermidine synthase